MYQTPDERKKRENWSSDETGSESMQTIHQRIQEEKVVFLSER